MVPVFSLWWPWTWQPVGLPSGQTGQGGQGQAGTGFLSLSVCHSLFNTPFPFPTMPAMHSSVHLPSMPCLLNPPLIISSFHSHFCAPSLLPPLHILACPSLPLPPSPHPSPPSPTCLPPSPAPPPFFPTTLPAFAAAPSLPFTQADWQRYVCITHSPSSILYISSFLLPFPILSLHACLPWVLPGHLIMDIPNRQTWFVLSPFR